MKRSGTMMTELILIVAVIGILATVAIPNFLSMTQSGFDASARSAGRNAKLAEEVWYSDQGGLTPSYTSSLDDLLSVDRNLTDDTEVTFTFGTCNTSGFTLWTEHTQGSTQYRFTD